MTSTRWPALLAAVLLISPLAPANEVTETFKQSLEALIRKDYLLAVAGFSAVLHLDATNVAAFHNRACAYHAQGDYARAINDYSSALHINPKLTQTLTCRGNAYKLQGDFTRAIADYQAAIQIDPKNSLAFNNLASLLATCPNVNIRDGKAAVSYATQACTLTEWKQPIYLDTLAAAYAQVGDFENAVKWQKKVVSFANLTHKDLEDACILLALYAEGKIAPKVVEPVSTFTKPPVEIVVVHHQPVEASPEEENAENSQIKP